MIFRFVLKFLQPIASLLARVNIESNVAIAGLRLFELLTRKAELTEQWAVAEKKRTQVAIGELLTNFKRWSDGTSPLIRAERLDTHGLDDEDEPCIDVCYISDMLVNMIAGDTQQLGNHAWPPVLTSDASEPWNFKLFNLGLDIILPQMTEENWKVLPFPSGLTSGHPAFQTFRHSTTAHVRTSDTTDIGTAAGANI